MRNLQSYHHKGKLYNYGSYYHNTNGADNSLTYHPTSDETGDDVTDSGKSHLLFSEKEILLG
jgi:hypothetical protein